MLTPPSRSIYVTAKPVSNQSVTLPPTHHSVCPVRAFMNFRHQREVLISPELPVFQFNDGTFLTHSLFNQAVKTLLKHEPHFHRYSSHSFRIGGATAAADQNTSETHIQQAGRWKSSA
ncbi:hypothetical protein RvY_03057-2 [Ramazzottius varieornatus]|uniref:Tyr recombinase domain-containing protein n=1 Tax=Ramazzottius varieornatus TaxID=947166 RepID=A0A1D1UW97_RAMVA|nr:hypothetical protein RvY_03057-2 [Ramazzottius varieornatus]